MSTLFRLLDHGELHLQEWFSLLTVFPPRDSNSSMASFFPTPPRHLRHFLSSGIGDDPQLHNLSAKVIHAHIRPPLAQVPPLFPQVLPAHWRQFWESNLPLKMYTIWWQLMHNKVSSQQQLFNHNFTEVDDPPSVLCGVLEDNEHRF
ncbi:hypothetical protein PHYBLDRAFT_143826 [Phycomyces blakesleeanus NRRL 1555(-)]|uniref:Uncharacterized protein n=1 Tax=Phycomyces blakesleeanus (strain ATCC 8743b / DSM 1359 / FGSC 10004 / NBRC 33097 / NRRL 1555) TaxID=763407 RepID=A0A167NBB9_PHYB8|nr:hypothetical protein PHYBLDRAFT_143826 [Phycomyces blakesleeanus NRRL 1555(-)]OAD75580.1 hypothetical protein PHYBLDRAFT_143826 [Phycomyces blakesleeanus NRRL 1555(-)]|eukprot:XP_018293620.1 hypothetical protein PHYBLDRAFT_143826 [Phycomyces blakesleeanus NRRL 1555(-)]